MNVLITSVGRRVSLVKAFKQELNFLFGSGKVYTVDVLPQMSAACQIADGAFEVPKISDPGYIEYLVKLCVEHQIKLIVPTIDTELLLLAQNQQQFLKAGTKVIISSVELIQICRDKRKTHQFLKEQGVEVAKEYDKNNFDFPIFIKPSDGSRSVDTYTIKSKEDMVPYHFKNPKLMFLEYLDSQDYDEYTCDLYYTQDSVLKCIVPRKRIEVRDGEVNKGLAVKNEIIPFIKEHLKTMEGAKGCITTQFFMHHTSKRIVGIEINPRFGGGYPLTHATGANYVRWILQEYLMDKTIPDQFEQWNENLLMLRFDEEIFVNDFIC